MTKFQIFLTKFQHFLTKFQIEKCMSIISMNFLTNVNDEDTKFRIKIRKEEESHPAQAIIFITNYFKENNYLSLEVNDWNMIKKI